MTIKRQSKWIHEGRYAAEVEVALIVGESDGTNVSGWSPYLSKDDAFKLDEVRRALREGNVARAARHATVYELNTIAG